MITVVVKTHDPKELHFSLPPTHTAGGLQGVAGAMGGQRLEGLHPTGLGGLAGKQQFGGTG